MQEEDDDHRSGFASCDETPEKIQRTPQNVGSAKRSIMKQEVKRRIHYTPRNSPDNYPRTLQSSGSFKRDTPKLLLESKKRKTQSPHNEGFDKIRKTCPGGKFVDTLIEQWSKHMGIKTPLPQTTQASPEKGESKLKRATQEQITQRLQKKLQATEEALSSLSASHDAELRAKEEILHQLNSDWESISKYYSEILESLKEFQKHKDNLTALYNDVIAVQQATHKKMQQELNTMKLRDEEQKNILNAIEGKVVNQEKRIQEMTIAEIELKKQLEDIKHESAFEKNELHNAHAEEKLKLIKRQENLASINRELQAQLKKITEEKQNLTNTFAEKDEEISKLQEEMLICKNRFEDLLCQNAELSTKYGESVGKGDELSKELQLKTEQMDKLRENLTTRQEIESGLVKDLDLIDNKYKNMQNDLTNVECKFKEAQIRIKNLEKALLDAGNANERKVVELNRKLELLEKEKDRELSEKCSKIQELDKSCKIQREKYEAEITSLKREFDSNLTEMKKTIVTQNSALAKLNDTLNILHEENQKGKENYNRGTRGTCDKLRENSQERLQQMVESGIIHFPTDVDCQTQTNQVREINEQQFQSQRNVNKSKIKSKEKNEVLNADEDIYNFSTQRINEDLQNLLSPTKQDNRIRFDLNSLTKVSDCTESSAQHLQNKNTTRSKIRIEEKQEKESEVDKHSTERKKIFRTRNSGLRQYGTPKRLQFESTGKMSKK